MKNFKKKFPGFCCKCKTSPGDHGRDKCVRTWYMESSLESRPDSGANLFIYDLYDKGIHSTKFVLYTEFLYKISERINR